MVRFSERYIEACLCVELKQLMLLSEHTSSQDMLYDIRHQLTFIIFFYRISTNVSNDSNPNSSNRNTKTHIMVINNFSNSRNISTNNLNIEKTNSNVSDSDSTDIKITFNTNTRNKITESPIDLVSYLNSDCVMM